MHTDIETYKGVFPLFTFTSSLIYEVLAMLLNESSNHCYLPYCKHDPTADCITSNATACL